MLLAPRSYEIGTWNVPHSDVTGRSPVGSAGGPPFPNQPNFLLWVPHPYWPILAGGPHIPVAHNCLLLAIAGLAPKAGITKLSRLESTRAPRTSPSPSIARTSLHPLYLLIVGVPTWVTRQSAISLRSPWSAPNPPRSNPPVPLCL